MSCANCGGATELVESEGGTTEGMFTEKYECVNCGAAGRIRGEAGKPAETWHRYGRVFNGDY